MNEKNIKVKRVLISVSDKTNLLEFAKGLIALNIEIISTGGTAKALRAENIPVRDVSDITHFPEMMDGRLKTLHPLIHGGILGLRDKHAKIAKEYAIDWIDLVVVNLYPFQQTIEKPNVIFEEAIENIDIGGPTMLRAAAKNMGWVGVVVDPADYPVILKELSKEKELTFTKRKILATKAFSHVANYDVAIADYLSGSIEQTGGRREEESSATFPDHLDLHLTKLTDLRYGENPHQRAAAYQFSEKKGILSAIQHQGKALSYNNIADADAAFTCVTEFKTSACVIIKHATPCGAAVADTTSMAFKSAYAADSLSAFGGVVAFNGLVDQATAELLTDYFIEVVIAPDYSVEALALLSKKPALRVLQLPSVKKSNIQIKSISGGLLLQEEDHTLLQLKDLEIVTKTIPTSEDFATMLFAWPILKHIKSNAILLAKQNVTVGVGAGQVSRIDAVTMALKKAGEKTNGAILASDAFFPFRDSIDQLNGYGIRAIIQPGGSVRDGEVIAAADEQNIAMVMTGKRCFKH